MENDPPCGLIPTGYYLEHAGQQTAKKPQKIVCASKRSDPLTFQNEALTVFAHALYQIAIKHMERGEISKAQANKIGSIGLLKRVIWAAGWQQVIVKNRDLLKVDEEKAYRNYLEILASEKVTNA